MNTHRTSIKALPANVNALSHRRKAQFMLKFQRQDAVATDLGRHRSTKSIWQKLMDYGFEYDFKLNDRYVTPHKPILYSRLGEGGYTFAIGLVVSASRDTSQPCVPDLSGPRYFIALFGGGDATEAEYNDAAYRTIGQPRTRFYTEAEVLEAAARNDDYTLLSMSSAPQEELGIYSTIESHHPNGQLATRCNYVRFKKHGWEKAWDIHGNLVKATRWENGVKMIEDGVEKTPTSVVKA